MKRAIITGANSFIGYRLCKILAENGYAVYAVIRRDNMHNAELEVYENITIVHCNMKNYGTLDSLVNEKCDVGIALAWNGTRGADRNDEKMQGENLAYSFDCIQAFARLGCSKILTAGSQAEYGPWFEKRKVTENDDCKPNTEYGKYKLAFYNKTSLFCKEKSITLIEPRFFSLYGDDDSEKTMIISMIRNMLRNEPCELTECVQLWDFLYIDDAIDALYKLIVSPTASGIYNFGSGISLPLREYINEMAILVNTKSEFVFGAIPYPATGIVNTNPAVERLVADINWKPKTTFSKGIEKVIRKQRKLYE